jgi:hypothetical protein
MATSSPSQYSGVVNINDESPASSSHKQRAQLSLQTTRPRMQIGNYVQDLQSTGPSTTAPFHSYVSFPRCPFGIHAES